MDTIQVGDVYSSIYIKDKFLKIAIAGKNIVLRKQLVKLTISIKLKSLPLVGLRAIRSIFLNMHTKETDIHPINVLKSKKCFCPIWKRL